MESKTILAIPIDKIGLYGMTDSYYLQPFQRLNSNQEIETWVEINKKSTDVLAVELVLAEITPGIKVFYNIEDYKDWFTKYGTIDINEE